MMTIPAVLLLAAVGAAAAGPPLSTAQQNALARTFVCPEKLPDDAARLQAVTRFMDDYAAMRPTATVNDRLAFRSRLLAKHHCALEGAQYTFPQS